MEPQLLLETPELSYYTLYILYLHTIFQAQTARNSSWVTIYEVNAPDAQSILVNGLVPFTTYRLRVIATNVVGSSAPSEPCKEFQTIQAPPRHPPRNVTVRAVSATNLRVRWIVSDQYRLAFQSLFFHNLTFGIFEDGILIIPCSLNKLTRNCY